MQYRQDDVDYTLNLIDTPGHVDFSYEVSRSIAACEGALLIVDASQGIQAQTISNLYMAIDNDLEVIPVINKCDLESAKPDEVEDQIVDLLGCDRNDIIRASGVTGHDGLHGKKNNGHTDEDRDELKHALQYVFSHTILPWSVDTWLWRRPATKTGAYPARTGALYR